MKIWLMNHYASLQYRDKSGRHYWFAKELKHRGNEPIVFCSSAFHDTAVGIDMKGKKSLIQNDEATDVPFVFVQTRPSVGNGMDRIKNMSDFYRNLFPAAKMVANQYGKPDVIIASSVHPLTMVAGIQIAKKLKVPCICEVRDLWPEAIFSYGKVKETSIFGRVLTIGEHWIYKKASALIFTKEGDTDYLKEKGWTTKTGGTISLSKCYYINNGIDLAVYKQRVHAHVLQDNDLIDYRRFNITYAGMVRPVNNVGNLLDCAKLLCAFPDIQFLIYGDGNQLVALRERIEKENITNVKLKGYVNRKYIPYVLSKSSINILNYSSNQFNWSRGNSSNKMFEYMASGKPIVSTVKMGYSIINKYRCGFELNECTPEALAQAIIRIHNMPRDEYEQLGNNAAEGAKDFDFIVLTDKLESVINSVVQVS